MILDESVDNYALVVYAYLNILMPLQEVEEYYISLNTLLFTIYRTTSISTRVRENIWRGLCTLHNLGYFKGDRVNKNAYIINTQSLRLDTQSQKFIIIYLDEVFKIMTSNIHNKPSLFSYYLFLIGTINSQITVYLENGKYKKNIIGNQTISQLSLLSGISAHTVMRNNTRLEELDVIYIHHSDDVFVNGKNNIKKLTNIYGRYNDQEYIEKYVNDYKAHFQSHSYLKKERTLANNDRRLSKMYYWLCKGKEYSKSEIQEIYDYITALNKKYENLSVKEQDDSYLAKIKDESIFKQFEFLKMEGENL